MKESIQSEQIEGKKKEIKISVEKKDEKKT